MNKLALLISTCFGLGYAPKGGGTLAAIACCIAWYFTLSGRMGYAFAVILVTVLLMAAGVWSAGRMERRWGKDNYRIVIDEVVGMCLSLLFIPVSWPNIIAGLILFRTFDIAKPLYIRRLEGLKGGWGVMMDDVLAGVYSNLILQVLVHLKLW
jgi:phosphatidylglycerophosphatase A